MIDVLIFIGGMALGAVACWLVSRLRQQDDFERGKAEGEAERAVLVERLQSKEQQIQTVTTERNQFDHQLVSVQLQLKAEGQKLIPLSRHGLDLLLLALQTLDQHSPLGL